ncbi:peptidoglycan D,D-transpeptidase FtsI family protein [Sphingomonas sp. M1-B02]|uniref:peptidoglycan D,D-transpeptidase FtsI family protein n=1 Tax=Sphingomonas sp. M1-B02 TaxID=3114300 RepID=UPI00223F2F76|nr:penicillin-binding protein 2 [Sphingomonas sp. S6-11]UZK67393.1 penicillin-binding protein 2 [Sphingomonas sp. S6-11]
MILVVAPPARSRRSGGARQALVAVAQVRLMILSLLFGFGTLVLVGKLALLALWAEPATARNLNAVLLPPRGDIVDRHGAPLARSIDAWAIAVHPNQVIGDKTALAQKLAALIPEQSAGHYYAMLNSGGNFGYLKRRAMPELVNAVNALGEPAIEFQREPDRLYPQSALAAHVLGFLDVTGHGKYGMERVLDAQLTDPARRGQPVPLSLDLRVQAALENELGSAMASFQAAGAAGVILDVRTGEVMAMVSLPSFNPNAIQGEVPRNNVTQARYELGSTFKPLAMAAAIDSGTVTSMARRFDATAPIRIGRFSISDDHPQRRFLNIPETLIYSSNIATARIADLMGQAPMEALFRRLGFDAAPEVEIEKAGTLWPSHWGRLTTMTTAYGHGIAITPLQLATAYAAMINGGIHRPATMLKVDKTPTGTRVFSESTSARMRQLLRLIVTDGTGKKADAPGFRVGGKTGTAERPGKGGYSANMNVSTFAAAFPMDAPRYVVIAMLDSPIGNAQSAGQRTAGWTAAPVVSRVVMRTGPLLGVIPDSSRDVDLSELKRLIWTGPHGVVASDR